MARESQVLRNMASHVCPLSEIQIQCLNAKTHEWTDVDVAQRKKDARYEDEKYKKYDAMKPKQFVPDRYRFFPGFVWDPVVVVREDKFNIVIFWIECRSWSTSP